MLGALFTDPDSGAPWWYNEATGESRWEPPTDDVDSAATSSPHPTDGTDEPASAVATPPDDASGVSPSVLQSLEEPTPAASVVGEAAPHPCSKCTAMANQLAAYVLPGGVVAVLGVVT